MDEHANAVDAAHDATTVFIKRDGSATPVDELQSILELLEPEDILRLLRIAQSLTP